MKRCPKCNLNYSDDTMEFCLEDGIRLNFITEIGNETVTVANQNKGNLITEKTADFPFSNPVNNLQFQDAAPPQTLPQQKLLKEKFTQQSNKALEIAPVIVSLAHNWWQWIYLNNQYYSSFSGYILSANFLMWLLLLLVGTGLGLLALKRSQNKSFAITSLVIIAVNLLLFLVPKR